MMPLDLTRLASPAACWPPCAAGWRSCAPPAAPAAAGPAAPGPRPLLAAVGPAGGAGVLIRILRWMLVIGAVSDDVIGSFGTAGRIRGVRAIRVRPAGAGLVAPAARERSPDGGQHEDAERGTDDHERERPEVRGLHR